MKAYSVFILLARQESSLFITTFWLRKFVQRELISWRLEYIGVIEDTVA